MPLSLVSDSVLFLFLCLCLFLCLFMFLCLCLPLARSQCRPPRRGPSRPRRPEALRSLHLRFFKTGASSRERMESEDLEKLKVRMPAPAVRI
jgi:hypothetical protein